MTPDLTPLEQAAARVGLPGLKARVVPHDRRRGWWFRWGDGELLVSDRVIDRCPPEDASALLTNDVLLRQERSRRSWPFLWIACPTALVLAVLWLHDLLRPVVFLSDNELAAGARSAKSWLDPLGPWLVLLVLVATLVSAWRALSLSTAQHADDRTVALLGDATPLVRGLNEMNFEEIHLAGKVLPARPDLHRRAERLVTKYRLCDAQPE